MKFPEDCCIFFPVMGAASSNFYLCYNP